MKTLLEKQFKKLDSQEKPNKNQIIAKNFKLFYFWNSCEFHRAMN